MRAVTIQHGILLLVLVQDVLLDKFKYRVFLADYYAELKLVQEVHMKMMSNNAYLVKQIVLNVQLLMIVKPTLVLPQSLYNHNKYGTRI